MVQSNDIIRVVNGVDTIDSRIAAEKLGNDHASLMRLIKEHQPSIEASFGKVGFEIVPSGKTNQPLQIATLTEDQALFIGTLSRNTEQAIRFKAFLVATFSEFRRMKMNPYIDKPKSLLLKEAYERELENEQLREEIAIYKPKAILADAVTAAYTTILVGDMAKILKQNGIDTGEKRFYIWLRNHGYVIKRNGMNIPTQYAMNLGLFEIKETPVVHNSGTSLHITPKITGKGQAYFIDKFLNQAKRA